MGLAIAGLVYVVHGRGAPGVEQHNSTSSAVVESRMPLEDEVELVTRERETMVPPPDHPGWRWRPGDVA
jgi:hypothetical protein